MSAYTIINPFRPRQRGVIIPKGTLIRSTNPKDNGWRVAGATRTVTLHNSFDGWVDTMNLSRKGNGFVTLPSVSWAGSSGYWQDAQVSEELCDANGVPMPSLPNMDEYRDVVILDVIPSYDPGYCDRWTLNTVARTRYAA